MAHRLFLAPALLALSLPAAAQVRTSPGDSAISEHTGSIGEVSRPVSEGSRPVKGDPTIGESSGGPVSAGRLRYGPVRESSSRGMLSGPVSSISSGPMTQPRRRPHGGSMTAASAGAVKHDRSAPLGTRISQPLRELGPLQEHLRAVRQHGDAAAIAAAGAPVAAVDPPIEPRDGIGPADAWIEEPAPVGAHAGAAPPAAGAAIGSAAPSPHDGAADEARP